MKIRNDEKCETRKNDLFSLIQMSCRNQTNLIILSHMKGIFCNFQSSHSNWMCVCVCFDDAVFKVSVGIFYSRDKQKFVKKKKH